MIITRKKETELDFLFYIFILLIRQNDIVIAKKTAVVNKKPTKNSCNFSEYVVK